MKILKSIASNFWVESTLNSYSIILFSNNKILALLLLFITFMTPKIGLVGLCFVLCFHIILAKLGYDKKLIKSGLLGFNAVLTGISIAYSYEINKYFVGLFFISVLIAVIIIVWCKNFFDRYHLPFLTIPFFFTANIIALAVSNFEVFKINMDYVFHQNTLVSLQQNSWYQWVHCLDTISIPNHFYVFLITLSTVFFQKSVLAGILILAGMFYCSRIMVVYSFIGFYSAYFFYSIMGGNLDNLNYFYSGANFIFLAISLGCFFYIPNKYSMVFVFLLSPILMFLMITLNKILFVFQMNSMSLSFSLLTTMTLYILYHRHEYKYIIPANIFHNSPEKSLYEYLHQSQRKVANPYYEMVLPFWGEWYVSQGYDGQITHLGDWGKALDFVIQDENENTFGNRGQKLDHFYCYNKPVVAPADGYVYDIINHVEDNEINTVNVDENWGNSIIINHLNGLYTQISHIKKDSFTVAIGDYIKKGTLVATCGNSGRSPEPHIHFQNQHYPVFGAKTVPLPLSYFIEHHSSTMELKINEIPREGSSISNVEVIPLLLNTFTFLPNNRLKITNSKSHKVDYFDIVTNEYNQLYFYCEQTGSKLYYKNDGTLFTFEKYEGKTNSSLFEFYKSCYSVLLGYYPTIQMENLLPNHFFTPFGLKTLNDIIAPIYNFMKVKQVSKSLKIDNIIQPNEITIESKYHTEIMRKSLFETRYTITIDPTKTITIHNTTSQIQYLIECEPYS
jgi:urea transporter/murein DD-endopeptidase MepM/ murein hydrolase activator NlpD